MNNGETGFEAAPSMPAVEVAPQVIETPPISPDLSTELPEFGPELPPNMDSTEAQNESVEPQPPEVPQEAPSEILKTPEELKLEGRIQDVKNLAHGVALAKLREVPQQPRTGERRPTTDAQEELETLGVLKEVMAEKGKINLRGKPLSPQNPISFKKGSRAPQFVIGDQGYRLPQQGETPVEVSQIYGLRSVKQGNQTMEVFVCTMRDNPKKVVEIPAQLILDAQLDVCANAPNGAKPLFSPEERQVVNARLEYVRTGDTKASMEIDDKIITGMAENPSNSIVSSQTMIRLIERAQPEVKVTDMVDASGAETEHHKLAKILNEKRRNLLDQFKDKRTASAEDMTTVFREIGNTKIDLIHRQLRNSRINIDREIERVKKQTSNPQELRQKLFPLEEERSKIEHALDQYTEALKIFEYENGGTGAIDSYVTSLQIGKRDPKKMEDFLFSLQEGNIEGAMTTIAESQAEKLPPEKKANWKDWFEKNKKFSIGTALGVAFLFLAIKQAMDEETGRGRGH